MQINTCTRNDKLLFYITVTVYNNGKKLTNDTILI